MNLSQALASSKYFVLLVNTRAERFSCHLLPTSEITLRVIRPLTRGLKDAGKCKTFVNETGVIRSTGRPTDQLAHERAKRRVVR